jgi:glycosyltransferase involved in cell wall biosynthesis
VRIAQLAPLYEPVPPPGYGGTELAVYQITEELVRRGHDVTLFASGDSETSARLAAPVPFALWSDEGRGRWPTAAAARAEEIRHVERCFARAAEFDIVHNHAGVEGMAAAIDSAVPVLTTHHHAFEPQQAPVFAAYPWAHHALSAAAARTFPARGQLPPIHHGIDVATYPFSDRPEGYLLFMGRIVPDKGAAYAIEIARRAGRELRIAGVTQEKSADYGRRVLAEADGRQIRYVGEAGPEEKRRLFGGADALLFPIMWDEPFGLVVIEAFACGTPVLAFAAGSAPELIEPGETGFLAEPGADPLAAGAGVDQLVEAIGRLGELSRRRCREEAERRFTVERMVDAYERTYDTVVSGADPAVPSGAAGADRAALADVRAVVDDELPGEARPAKVRE